MVLRDIPGFIGLYAASDDGRIYSHRAQAFLRPGGRARRYLMVKLLGRTVLVHLLVAAAWLPPKPTRRHQINHIDADRRNNAPSNLEWCTSVENVRHSLRMGLRRATALTIATAIRHGRASNLKRRKLSRESVVAARARALAGATQASLAREFGISEISMSRIINRVTYKDIP